MKWIVVLVLVAGSAASALAQEGMGSAPPEECFANPHAWAFDRTKENLAEPGQRFFADMQKCAPTFASSIEEAVRYQIHDVEAKKAARNNRFVIAAYGIAWGLLALAAMALVLRQQKLSAQIRELEAKLRTAASS